jgi:hypothetical protein
MAEEWIRKPTWDQTVIFVHGILSSGDTAWTYRPPESAWTRLKRRFNGADPPPTTRWPELLKDNDRLKPVGIYVFTYPADIFSGNYSLSDAVDSFNAHLQLAKLLDGGTLIFVCHSMGGILVRRFLVSRQAELIEKDIRIGLFLVGSPSLGSAYANLIEMLARVFGNTQAQALRFSQNNVWLNDVDKDFTNLKEKRRLRIEGKELVEDKFVVLKKFIREQIVAPFSGARYFADPVKIENSDHFSIAKPKDKDALQHELLVQFIENMIYLPDPQQEARQATEYAKLAVERLNEMSKHEFSKDEAARREQALAAYRGALLETRKYLKARHDGAARDAKREDDLSSLWHDAADQIWPFDSDLAKLAYIKGHGWADDRIWSDPLYKDLPLQLDALLARVLSHVAGSNV